MQPGRGSRMLPHSNGGGPQDRAARLQQNAPRQQCRRAVEGPQDRAARVQQNAATQQCRRAEEDPQDRAARLQQNAARQQCRRAEEDPQHEQPGCSRMLPDSNAKGPRTLKTDQ